MQRPRVVMSVGASVDGKVALTRKDILMREPSRTVWNAMTSPVEQPLDVIETVRQRYGCNAILEGSGSLVREGEEPAPLPPTTGDTADLYTDFLPAHIVEKPSPPHMWFTAVDSRGRVRWDEDHDDWDCLVWASAGTPADYLAYLRRQQVCYLIAGEDRVDLEAALIKMSTLMGIDCVLSTASGGLNGALLRAGLIDELYLSVSPALIGGADTPTVLDGPPLEVGASSTPLRLLSCRVDAGGLLILHYEVGPQQ